MNNEHHIHITITDLPADLISFTLDELIDHPDVVWSGDRAHRFGEHAAIACAGFYYKVQRVGGDIRVLRYDTRRQLRYAVNKYNELF